LAAFDLEKALVNDCEENVQVEQLHVLPQRFGEVEGDGVEGKHGEAGVK